MDSQEKTIQINIEKQQLGQTPVSIVSLNGYIDSYNSQYYQSTVMGLIEEGQKHLIVDASQLSYVSSAGIGAFMAITRRLDDDSGELVLCSLNTKVMEVFNLLGFTSFFQIADNKEGALKIMQEALSEEESDMGLPGESEELLNDIIFPLVFSCPSCSRKLKVPKEGKYRCTQCQKIISVDSSGSVSLAG